MTRTSLFLGFVLTMVGTANAQPTDQPPEVLPSSCSAILIANLSSEEGTRAFHLLRYEIEALKLGHEGNNAPLEAIAKAKTEAGDGGLSTMLIGMSTSEDKFACAAFVMGRFPANSEDENSVRSNSILVYNALSDFSTHMKARFVKKFQPADASSSSPIEDAQELADLTKKRNDAISMLLDTVAVSVLLSKTTGTNPNLADTWNMKCSERKVLLNELEPYRLKLKTFDDFEKTANLVQETLMQNTKCLTNTGSK